MKALVVESSDVAAETIRERLAGMNIETLCVYTGASALEAFGREHPGLVLLNPSLADMDGYEVVRLMRQSERPGDWTPIVLLAPQTTEQELERGLASGGDDYIEESVSPAIFAAKVRALQRIASVRESLLNNQRLLEATNASLRSLTAVDGLTSLANRRHFDETLRREWRRAQRTGQPLGLVMCDIDHFKKYNDSLGHQRGDECLRRVAQAIAGCAKRSADVAARYGGEEFALILPETGPAGAETVARAVREAVESLRIEHKALGRNAKVTVSVGACSLVPAKGVAMEDLVEAADHAMYEAKRNGRNSVRVAESAELLLVG